jgi:HNH endonuclease
MRIELIFIIAVGLIIFNVYTEGKYTKIFYSYKKYFRISFIIFVAIICYLMIKRNPHNCKNILLHANNMVKFMPIDRSSMDMISPIIDFTGGSGSANPYVNRDNSFMHNMTGPNPSPVPNHGGRIVKRSVSETKKKYVASNQNWKCGHCGKQLNAWFEVDHKIRLDNGGSNEVQNLVALCRECHGEKTAKENM